MTEAAFGFDLWLKPQHPSTSAAAAAGAAVSVYSVANVTVAAAGDQCGPAAEEPRQLAVPEPAAAAQAVVSAGNAALSALEKDLVGAAGGTLVAETVEEAPTVVTTLHDLSEETPASQASVVEVALAVASVAGVVNAGETVAGPVPAAAE